MRQSHDRWAHQPLAVPKQRAEPGVGQLHEACGQTVALVLACDVGVTPLVVEFDEEGADLVTCGEVECGCPGVPRPLQLYEGVPVVGCAVSCALACGFAAVRVLAGGDEQMRHDIETAVRRAVYVHSEDAGRQVRPPVDVVPFDGRAARAATLAACGFELYDLEKGVLDYGTELLEAHSEADSVLFMPCDAVRVTPAHILELFDARRVEPEADVFTSWVMWIQRLPLLVSRRLLESLGQRGCLGPGPGGVSRALPYIRSRDVVFGEEKLAPNPTRSARLDAFSADVTLSARQAVALARSQREHPDAAAAHAVECTAADGELLAIACDVVGASDAYAARLSERERTALEAADAWAWRNREDFPLLCDEAHRHTLAYLDAAATTQRCQRTLCAQAAYDTRSNANVYRGEYELSRTSTALFDQARHALARFIGAPDAGQVSFCSNASAACNTVAQAWGRRNIARGDLIVAALSEHHSNLMPWVLLADEVGARVECVHVGPDGRLDMDAYAALCEQSPKLVCVAHVSNTLGIVNPVRRMAYMAHASGARLMLDIAQSVAHVPLAVAELGCDFAALSAHKMYGPMGIGALWVADDAFDEMEPACIGGGTISHVSLDSWYFRTKAIQYELGTPPVSQAVGWMAAVEYLETLGMDAVHGHDAAMLGLAEELLGGIEGITLWGDHSAEDGVGGLLCFSLPGVESNAMTGLCGALGVAIRGGGHCALPLTASLGMRGMGRMSVSVHTTREDIEALAAAVEVSRRLLS